MVGIRNSSLSEKLQLDAELTPTMAVAKVRQAEEIKKQQALLWGETAASTGKKPEIPVGAVQKGRRGGKPLRKPRSALNQPSTHSQPQTAACTRCGRTPSHDRQSCPARDAICRKYSKRGHFQSVCHSIAKVGEVCQGDPDTFLGTVDRYCKQLMETVSTTQRHT